MKVKDKKVMNQAITLIFFFTIFSPCCRAVLLQNEHEASQSCDNEMPPGTSDCGKGCVTYHEKLNLAIPQVGNSGDDCVESNLLAVPNSKKADSQPQLHSAIKNNDIQTVQKLLQQEGINIMAPNDNGETPYSLAQANVTMAAIMNCYVYPPATFPNDVQEVVSEESDHISAMLQQVYDQSTPKIPLFYANEQAALLNIPFATAPKATSIKGGMFFCIFLFVFLRLYEQLKQASSVDKDIYIPPYPVTLSG